MSDDKIHLRAIYENAVVQELYAHEFQTWFYNSHKNGELDFLIEEDDGVVPIDVKIGILGVYSISCFFNT